MIETMAALLIVAGFIAATAALSTLACCALARTLAIWRPAAATAAVTVCMTLLALRALAWAAG